MSQSKHITGTYIHTWTGPKSGSGTRVETGCLKQERTETVAHKTLNLFRYYFLTLPSPDPSWCIEHYDPLMAWLVAAPLFFRVIFGHADLQCGLFCF